MTGAELLELCSRLYPGRSKTACVGLLVEELKVNRSTIWRYFSGRYPVPPTTENYLELLAKQPRD